ASGSDDGTIRFWDPLTGESRGVWTHHRASVQSVAFSPDGAWIASGGFDGKWLLAKLGQAKPRFKFLEGHKGPAQWAGFDRQGKRLATSGRDGDVILWDVATAAKIRSFHVHTKACWCVAFHPDGSAIAVACDDGNLKLIDATTGAIRWSVAVNTSSMCRV